MGKYFFFEREPPEALVAERVPALGGAFHAGRLRPAVGAGVEPSTRKDRVWGLAVADAICDAP